MGRRAVVKMVGVSGLVASLVLPTGAAASPIAQDGRAGGGWSWPAGWSAACNGPSAAPGPAVACNAIELDNAFSWQGLHVWANRAPGASRSPVTTVPAATPPSGYSPVDLQSAYDLSSSTSTAGTGNTVAIVDAYNDPDALSNLSTYRAEFDLPPVCTGTTTSGCVRFTQESQTGRGRLPSSDVGWSEEISVDLDMVSAICPHCNILLVEANSATFAHLGAAEGTAAAAGPVSIGNSYGGGEPSSETSMDTYYHHTGIAIAAATGDSGYGVEYPAASPYMIAVGGTTLDLSTSGGRETETAWSGAGSGCSAYEAQPSWQSLTNLTGKITSERSKRAVADVSAVADPNTGVAVYDSYGLSGWTVFGGTSVSTQIISAIYGVVGGLGTNNNGGAASGLYYTYNDAPGDFFNITSVSAGTCGTDLCNAGPVGTGPPGWAPLTGRGAF